MYLPAGTLSECFCGCAGNNSLTAVTQQPFIVVACKCVTSLSIWFCVEQLNAEGAQQIPAPLAASTQNANLQQTLLNLRSTISKKIQFRRNRSGVQSVVLPSPDTCDDRRLTVETQGTAEQGAGARSRMVSAIILDSSSTSRYAESEFVPRSPETDRMHGRLSSSVSQNDIDFHNASSSSSSPVQEKGLATNDRSRAVRGHKTRTAGSVSDGFSSSTIADGACAEEEGDLLSVVQVNSQCIALSCRTEFGHLDQPNLPFLAARLNWQYMQ